MTNYLELLPEEIYQKIFRYYLLNIVHSSEFEQKRKYMVITYLQKTLSRKQYSQLCI